MKFLYDKELFHRYYKEILKNICLLLMISSLSVIAPLILRNATDITLKDGFHTGKILIYLIVLTMLYAIKFLYNRFRFWFTEKFKNEETRNLYQKIFHVSYNKINEMEPSYIQFPQYLICIVPLLPESLCPQSQSLSFYAWLRKSTGN